MAKRMRRLVFPPELIREPILYNLGQEFKVVTNILRADVEIDKGWVVLQLEGNEEEMEQAISWLTAKGVSVEPTDLSISA